ncbi:MAG: YcgL domain-containing protein [Pseudomonadota bacterium]|jgi:uncharacterized protein YcgL (UPF0745 family)|nr:YcgL domain-containing protein [Pseudomonadota bacterium]MDO7667932.1 YcgL domain-containing protein [Pseudomonadota bacterium]MDO7710811.1 YcgL domain-containing protein [Pseudomonadota bacterium]
MNAYIYKSSRKAELYIYITQRDDFSNVPQALYDSMGKEPVFVMEIELTPERKLARENVNTVINNLETKGFHLQIPPPIANIIDFKEPAKYVS